MKWNWTCLAAAAMISASAAQAQDTQTRTETTVRTEAAPGTAVRTTTEENTTVNSAGQTVTTRQYEQRMSSAYRTAGVPAADINRLVQLDLQARAAIEANERAKVQQYYEQQTTILGPERVEKVRVYLRENPVVVPPPPAPVAPPPGTAVVAPAPVPGQVLTTYEYVPAQKTGVSLDTPLGSVGLGVTTNEKVIEQREVVVPPPPAP